MTSTNSNYLSQTHPNGQAFKTRAYNECAYGVFLSLSSPFRNKVEVAEIATIGEGIIL